MKLSAVIMTISRRGSGKAKGRTSRFCESSYCEIAISGMKVTPVPFSTILMNVSMLPRV